MTNLQALGLFTLASPLLLGAFFILLFNVWPEFTQAKRGPVLWWAVLISGALVDLWTNIVWGTVLFLQIPDVVQRGFLSARMDQIIVNGSTGPKWLQRWRLWLALQVVGRLLEPFDRTGQHSTHGKFKR